MSYDPKNLEYAQSQINAMRERARLDAMIREAQPAKVATSLRARVALILRRVAGRSAKNLGATRVSADSTTGLLILPNLIVGNLELPSAERRNHKMF